MHNMFRHSGPGHVLHSTEDLGNVENDVEKGDRHVVAGGSTDNQGGRQRGGDVGKNDGHIFRRASKEQRGGDTLHQRNRIRFNLIPQ